MAVVGYHVYSEPTRKLRPQQTATYSDTTVIPGTQYSYTVSAFDAAGKHSAQSSTVVIDADGRKIVGTVAMPPTRVGIRGRSS